MTSSFTERASRKTPLMNLYPTELINTTIDTQTETNSSCKHSFRHSSCIECSHFWALICEVKASVYFTMHTQSLQPNLFQSSSFQMSTLHLHSDDLCSRNRPVTVESSSEMIGVRYWNEPIGGCNLFCQMSTSASSVRKVSRVYPL